jgi:hypothetical protein
LNAENQFVFISNTFCRYLDSAARAVTLFAPQVPPESTFRCHVTLAVTSIAKEVNLSLSKKKGMFRTESWCLPQNIERREISGFRREVAENCALLGNYAASRGNFLPTVRNILLVPSAGTARMGPIGSPETSVRNCHYSLCNIPSERSCH